MEKPIVSIILATRNRANLVQKSIQSVISQSFKDWELIVIDDASEDETPKVIKEWQEKDKRIIYLRNEVQSGISKTSNKGLRQARGEYIAIIDDDDYWAINDKLERQVKFLDQHPDYVGVGGGLIVIDEKSKEKLRYLKPETDEAIRKKALFANPMANITTVFRKNAAEKVDFYDESFSYAADWEFWLKMGRAGKLYNFPDYFAYYLMTGQNTSFVEQRKHFKNGLRIIKRYKNDYPGFQIATILVGMQYIYSLLPFLIRQHLNPFFSRIKKIIFSSRS